MRADVKVLVNQFLLSNESSFFTLLIGWLKEVILLYNNRRHNVMNWNFNIGNKIKRSSPVLLENATSATRETRVKWEDLQRKSSTLRDGATADKESGPYYEVPVNYRFVRDLYDWAHKEMENWKRIRIVGWWTCIFDWRFGEHSKWRKDPSR